MIAKPASHLARHALRGARLAAAGAALMMGLAGWPVAQAAAKPAGTLVYIGTHGGKAPGQGIFSVRLDPKTGVLSDLEFAAGVERPTWLVVDPKRPVLYAVSETGNDGKSQGGVYSLAIDPKTGWLKTINHVQSGGSGATFLSYDSRLSTVFVANFGGGAVSAVPVEADGMLGPVSSTQVDTGSGPLPRQKSPHAHASVIDPTGHFVLAPDLGADRVFVYRVDPATKALSAGDPPFVATGPGTGPRHLVFSPDGRFAYLDTELSAQLFVFKWDAAAGQLTPVQNLPIDKPDFKGERSAAELAVSKDGRFLYMSDRGANTLQVYAINKKTGTVTQRQEIAGGGDIPWSFGIDPTGRWMIVANENSSTLSVFKIDRTSGKLTPTGQSLAVFKPVAIAFYPQ
ncbi:MAG TPA: lactonase family protein [Caulobacteraceae bacterium]|nr:lactonase family protein [Caulobacteraceae bacterium]